MSTQHAPGPWHVEAQQDIDLDGNGYTWAIRAAGQGYVQNPAYATGEANARLIAASPALLAAAEQVALFLATSDHASHADDCDPDAGCSCFVSSIPAAIDAVKHQEA
jgi:hypothetical protein